LRDRYAAEELAAEVFATALAAFQKGTEPRQVGSWLVGIADHMASRFWRHKRVEGAVVEAGPVVEEDPEELALGRLEGEVLWKCMDALSPEHRKVLLLRIVAGLSAREVGEIMEKTEEAIRSLQFRALAALRQLWKEAEVRDGRPRAAGQ